MNGARNPRFNWCFENIPKNGKKTWILRLQSARLASDRNLIVQLAKEAAKNSGGRREELDRLIASTEQEKRNVQRQLDNLLNILADQSDGMNSKAVLEKIAERERQRDQLLNTLNSMRSERERNASVIDVEQVFTLFRYFREGFELLPVNKQRDLLREVVHKITVTEDGIRVLYYASGEEEVIKINAAGDLPAASDLSSSASEYSHEIRNMYRTSVRAASNLVES